MRRLAFVLWGSLTQLVFAKSVEVPLHFAPQEQNNWCWAATAQSVLSADGRSFEQCVLAGISLRKPYRYCCDAANVKYCDRGFHPTIALETHGLQTKTTGPLSLASLRAQLESGRPVIVSVAIRASINHAVVIYGLTESDEMKIWDPEHGGKKVTLSVRDLERTYGEWESSYLVTSSLKGLGPNVNPSPEDSVRQTSELQRKTQELGKPRATPVRKSNSDLDDLEKKIKARVRGSRESLDQIGDRLRRFK